MKKIYIFLMMLAALCLPGALRAQTTVEIGDGTSAFYYTPIGTYYNYSITEQLYTASEIGTAGTISSISFYWAYTTAEKNFDITIYMANVDAADLSTGISLADADEVFSGNISLSATAGWVTITLDAPFAYDGTSNLLIGVNKTGGSTWFSGNTWRYTSATDMARYSQQDGSAYTTSTIPGTKTSNRPNIQLEITPSSGPTCDKPGTFDVSNINTHGATLTWENTGASSYTVEYKKASDDTWTVVTGITTNSYTLTSLAPGTAYNTKVKAVCGTGLESGYKTANFTTSCGAITTFPWTENFESYASGNFSDLCWVNEHISGDGSNIFKVYTSANGTNSTHQLQLPDQSGGTLTKLVLPEMALPDNNYMLSIDVYRSNSTYNSNNIYEGVRVYVSTNGEIEGATELTFIPRQYNTSSALIPAEESVGWYTYELPLGISGTCYIILRGENQYCTSTYMDNFSVKELPTCAKPNSLAKSNVTAHTADLNWTSDATAFQICLNNDEEHLIDVTSTSHTLTGLTSETPYTAKVRTNCGGTYSDWSNTVSFTTTVACPVPTVAVSNITTTTAEVSCTNTDATSFNVKLGDDVVATGVTMPYTLTGLTENTSYTVKVQAICGGGDGESEYSAGTGFMTAEVCPSGMVCIGTGTATSNYLPAYNYYNYSYSQQIYTATEIGQVGQISSIEFKNTGAEKTFTLNIYMAATDKTSFESTNDWVALNTSDLVFSGEVTFGVGEWTSIDLTNPFNYDGTSNLLITVANVTGDYSNSPHIACLTFPATNQALYAYRDASAYDITAPDESGTKPTSKNRVRFAIGAPPACAKPTGLAVNYTNGTTAEVSWTSNATAWNIDVNGTVTAITDNPYTLTGLDLSTTYEVKVQANCGSNGTSEWTNAVSFTTDLCLPADQCEINYSFTDQYNDSWNGASIDIVDVLTNTIIANVTMPSVTGPYTGSVSVCNSREIQFVWHSGNFDSECGYTFTDLHDDEIFSGSGAMSAPVNYTSNCAPITCPKPTNLSVSTTDNSATLTWTVGGSEGSWKVYQNDLTTPVATVSTNSYTFTGLTGNTDYTLGVAAVCGVGDESIIVTAAAHTACDAITTFDYTVGFEDPTDIECWTAIDDDGDGEGWYIITGMNNHSGNACITSASYNSVALTPDNWLITPALTLPNNRDMQLSWWERGQDASFPAETYSVYISTTGNATTDFNTIDPQPMFTATGEYVNRIINLSAYRNQTIWIAFRHYDCTDQFRLNIDDFSIEDAPTCAAPSDVTVESWTGNTVTISWTDNNGGSATYEILDDADNVITTITDLTTTGVTITGLIAETQYALGDFKVRARCSSTDVSSSTNVPSFYTGYCQPAPGNVDGYGITAVSFGNGSNVVNNTSYPTSAPFYGDYHALVGTEYAGTTASIDITYETGTAYQTIIWVDWDNDLNFEDAEQVYNDWSDATNPTTLTATFNIPSTQTLGNYRMRIGGSPVYFGYFEAPCYSGANYEAVFHDYTLNVAAAPSCLPPSGITVDNTTVDAHGATISWTENGTATAWQVAYSVNAADSWSTPVDVATTPEYAFTGLTPETAYDVRVRTNCGGDYSEWVTLANAFTTDIACPTPTALTAGTPTANSVELSWTAGGSETAWHLYISEAITAPADDIALTEVTNVTNNTYTVDGLTAGTNYYVWVRANCGTDGFSTWVGPETFTTLDGCPAGMLCIGDGTATNSYLPTYTFYNYSLTQQIYTADEIGASGTINSIAFKNTGTEKTRTFNIYMQQTVKESFANGDDWVSTSADDLVFAGELTFTSGEWTTITLANPFTYNGSCNLIVTVADVTGTYSSGMSCLVFNATNQAIRAYRDGSAYDINAPGVTGTVLSVKNQIQLGFTPSGNPICETPSSFEISDTTAAGATFTWTSSVNNYVFEYKKATESTWTEESLTSNTLTLNTLEQNTAYNARVKAVCGTNSESCYLYADFTTKEACPTPTDLAVTYTNGNTAEVSWTSSVSAWNIDVNGTVTAITENPYTLTGLALATTYEVKVQADCGSDGTSEWTNAVSFTTDLCLPADQCLLTFDLTDSYGDGWNGAYIDVVDVATNTSVAQMTNQNLNGTTGSGTNELNTLTLSVCNGREIQFVWHSGSFDSEASYVVKDVNGDDIFSGSGTMSAPVTYTVDCAVSTCLKPTGLALASAVEATSAQLAWTENGDATAWKVGYKVSTATDFTEVDASTNPFTLTGLDPETEYTVKVRPACSDASIIKWSDEITFTTADVCPTGKVCIGAGYETNSSLPTNINYNYSLTQQIYTAAEMGAATGAIYSIDFHCSGSPTRNLDIYMVNTTKESFASTTDWISVTPSDLVFSGEVTFAADDWTTITLDNPFVLDGTSNVALIVDDNTGSYVSSRDFYVFDATSQAIRVYSDANNYDPEAPSSYYGTVLNKKNRVRLVIGEPPACNKPTGLAVNYTNGTTAEVSWTSNATAWNIDVNGTVTAITDNPYTLTGLDLSTTYEVKVQADCGSIIGTSEWTNAVSFTTPDCWDGQVVNYEFNDSYNDGWNGNAIKVYAYQNCVPVLVDSLTMSSGSSSSGSLFLCDDYYEFVWNKGSYPGETSWTFTDGNGNTLFTGTGNTSMSTGDVLYVIDSTLCPKPTDLAAGTPGADTVVLSWTENGSATAWQICLNGDETNLVTADANPFTLTGLTDDTYYTVKVRAYCDATSQSCWSEETSFTTQKLFTITLATVTGGTIQADPAGPATQNTVINLTATPDAGYQFDGWSVQNTSTSAVVDVVSNQFSMPAGNVNVSATFSQIGYTVASTPTVGGSVSGTGTYHYNDVISLTAEPATGYHFVKWEDNSTSPTRTITVTGDVNVTATFSLTDYTITLASVTGGTIGSDPAGTATMGTNVTLTATPATGYTFGGWSVQNTSTSAVVDVVGNQFSMPAGNVNVNATFTLNSYAIAATANPTVGGTVAGAGNYDHFATATLTATPATGYHFVNWTEGGTEVSTTSTYTFQVTGARTLVANFAINSYTFTVTANPTEGGTVTGAGDYDYNATATLTATANNGYHFVNWTNANDEVLGSATTLSIQVVSDSTVTANFAITPAELSWNPNTFTGYALIDFNNYKPTLNNPHGVSVRYGIVEDNSIIVDPVNGTITNNFGSPVLSTVGTFHIYAVHETDPTYYYDSVVYTLNVDPAGIIAFLKNIDEGGTIAFDNPVNDLTHAHHASGLTAYLAPGASTSATATAAEGFHFVKWQTGNNVDGYTDYTTDTSATVTVPTGITELYALGLKAIFDTNQYVVTATVNPTAGGTVSGAGTFKHFVPGTLTATANDGYHFVNWTNANGDILGTATTLEISAVSDTTITANFDTLSYTITATADPTVGGTVDGAGTYKHFTTATLTATPATGYSFVNWTNLAGDVLGTTTTLDIEVVSDSTVKAVFSANDYNLTIHYLFENYVPAALSHIENVTYNDNYTVVSPAIDNYMPDKVAVTGTMGANSIIDTVIYTQVVMDAISDQTLCANGTTDVVNFNSTVAVGTMSYDWVCDNITIGLAASGNGNIDAFNVVNTGTTPVTATVTVTPKCTNDTLVVTGIPQTFTITVNPIFSTPISAQICQGETYPFFGQDLTTSNTYTQMLQSVNGCDSLITITLTVNVPTHSDIYDSICAGLQYNRNNGFVFNTTVDQAGTWLTCESTDAQYFTAGTLTNAKGCDSTVTLHLYIKDCGDQSCGNTVYDQNANAYGTIDILNPANNHHLCWMTSNLRATHYANGNEIPFAMPYTSASGLTSTNNLETYGRLYTWYSAVGVPENSTTAPTADSEGHVQGVCPDGWHVPSAAEFNVLIDQYTVYELRDTANWITNSFSPQGTNTSGFKMEPAGIYNAAKARCEHICEACYYYTSEVIGGTTYVNLYSWCGCDSFTFEFNPDPNNGYSIRCVKDLGVQ